MFIFDEIIDMLVDSVVIDLLEKALHGEFLTHLEGKELFNKASTPDLMRTAHQMRLQRKPGMDVTWIIDRNVNTTNVCIANCKFCNFFRRPGHEESYITDIETYKVKIEETFRLGGDQLLLQGGHHPDLGLQFYDNLFKELKELYPDLGPFDPTDQFCSIRTKAFVLSKFPYYQSPAILLNKSKII